MLSCVAIWLKINVHLIRFTTQNTIHMSKIRPHHALTFQPKEVIKL